MTEAPKRIWLLPFDGEQRCWCDHPDPSGMGHEDEADEYIRADLVAALEAENQRLREAVKYDADAAKGMTKIVDLGGGAGATIMDPRSFENGGADWVMRYGKPCSIRFVAASLLESYDGLLSDTITTREAVRRLRLMRNARAALNGEGAT